MCYQGHSFLHIHPRPDFTPATYRAMLPKYFNPQHLKAANGFAATLNDFSAFVYYAVIWTLKMSIKELVLCLIYSTFILALLYDLFVYFY
jgi:hypothetical protein